MYTDDGMENMGMARSDGIAEGQHNTNLYHSVDGLQVSTSAERRQLQYREARNWPGCRHQMMASQRLQPNKSLRKNGKGRLNSPYTSTYAKTLRGRSAAYKVR